MMKRALAVLTAVGSLSMLGCQPQQNNAEINAKLDDIKKKLEDLDKKVSAMPARPMPQQPAGPDPQAVYAVPVEGAPIKGPKDAKVTIVEAFEFACPFCERVRTTVDEIQKQYGNDVRIVPRQFIVHPQVATLPAYAACAANKQGKYEKMERLLWDKGFNNKELSNISDKYSEKNIEAIAKEAGLDLNKFKADISGDCPKIIQNDQSILSQVGVRGTPTFYINGRYISGAQPFENFKRVIDEELNKANEALKKGVKLEDLYTETVLKTGKKST